MLEFVNKYAGNVHSQNGEDLIIAEVCRRLDLSVGHCVEVGGNNGIWLSNTALLLERGWSGIYIEVDFGLWQQCRDRWKQRPDVKCICSRVDGNNVNAFVDDSCDLLSLDTDGGDWDIFKGLKAKPKIVIVEIDSRIPPQKDAFSAEGGAGYRPMVRLGIDKGYFLLCHVGNLIFIADRYRHVFPEVDTDPLEHPEAYFLDAILTGDRSYLAPHSV